MSGVQGTPSRRVQEKVPQEKQLGINELILQGEVRGVPVQQKVERTEEGGGAEGHSVQRKIVGQEQNKTGGRDMGLSHLAQNVFQFVRHK
jgi:hypothetical protein